MKKMGERMCYHISYSKHMHNLAKQFQRFKLSTAGALSEYSAAITCEKMEAKKKRNVRDTYFPYLHTHAIIFCILFFCLQCHLLLCFHGTTVVNFYYREHFLPPSFEDFPGFG